MTNTDFTIEGLKKDIAPLVYTAARFTANSPGAASYLKCIHIVADDGMLTMTGSSETEAIRVHRHADKVNVDIVTEGSIMVQSNWITTALGVIQDDHYISLSYDTETRRLNLMSKAPKSDEGWEQAIDLALPKIDAKSAVPTVGEPDTDNGVSFDPEDFVNTYYSASVARDVTGTRPLVSGVLIRTDEDAHKIRMMSTDAKLATVMNCLDYHELTGSGFGTFLLADESTRPILEYLKQGASVSMHRDARDQAHLIVHGAKDEVLYHIRAATVNQDASKYPEAQMAKQISAMMSHSMMDVTVDKAELLRILRSAASIGSLDIAAIGGQAQHVSITITENGELISEVTTSASYREEIDADVEVISMKNDEVTFHYRFGTHSSMLETYNNSKDPHSLRFHLLKNPKAADERPMAILICEEDPITEDGSLADYVSLVSVKNSAS